jgi:hypothetical protein
LLLQEVAVTHYPPEITQRFHGTPEQMAAALVGEPPAKPEHYSLAKNEVIDAIYARIFSSPAG